MNEKVIWDFLMEKIGNQYGVAALMGNLYVESHLDPKYLQSSYERKLKTTSDAYTADTDSGAYAEEQFIHDSAGYGLAQWTYWSRKKNLYDHVKACGKSIGDLNAQLDFMWSEIQLYGTVVLALKTGKSVREISDVVCKKYLRPANQSEYYLQNRANYGEGFYKNLATINANDNCTVGGWTIGENPTKMVVAKKNVNVRVGNGKNYERVGALKAGQSRKWVATSDNGWHAIVFDKRVCWVSGEFSEVE